MALFHEALQAEVFAEAAQTLGVDLGLERAAGSAPREPLACPATRWRLGSDGSGWHSEVDSGSQELALPEFEIDAGPVIDGFGTAASAFGIAAARRNGRFDHAYTLSAELAAASWTLPDGTMLLPRLTSHAADAPYLGETAIMYFLTVPPIEGAAIRSGDHAPPCVWLAFLVYFGLPLGVGFVLIREWRAPSARIRHARAATITA